MLSVAFSTLAGLAAYASDFSFWQITFNVRAIHRQVDQACTSCFRTQQRIQAIEKRLNKLSRENFCPQQTRQLTQATAELLLLRRSMQSICGEVDRAGDALKKAASQQSQSCDSCVEQGQCGACPNDAARLRQSCNTTRSQLYKQQCRFSRLLSEMNLSQGRFQDVLKKLNNLLP